MKNDSQADILNVIETEDGIIFGIYVQPKASRNEVCGICGNELKLRLTSPPVEGSANRMCMEYLAKLLGVAKSKITIVRGEKSRHKTVKAVNVKKDDLLALLNEMEC
ncbi:MAG: hypothetical protein H6Q57_1161 [Geobacteraceae bacterium]|nr:hypothetical protein [Geobacteraceae bacterium]